MKRGVPVPADRLTAKDYARNSAEALLKVVPYIGEGLVQFIFGPLQERRQKRLEQTLTEVGESLVGLNCEARIQTEQFANLLEVVGPQLARAADEVKRLSFRQLLTNAATLGENSGDWSTAQLAGALVTELDPPALAVLAAIHRSGTPRSGLLLVSRPVPQVVDAGSFNWDRPAVVGVEIHYPWPVIDEWFNRLREKRVVALGSVDARGGFGAVALTSLGNVLVQWALRDRSSATR